jgi:hypothetical protein
MVGTMLRAIEWTLYLGCVADDAAQHDGEDLILRMQVRVVLALRLCLENRAEYTKRVVSEIFPLAISA